MTDGDYLGAKGLPKSAWLIAGAGPVLFAGVNIWTRLHEQPALAAQGRAWEVVTWEVSSALATLALLPLAAYPASRLGTGRPLAVALAKVAACAAAFVIVHVLGFVLLRKLVYLLQGSAYRFGGLDAWLYELPKDLVTFAILFGVFAVMRKLQARDRHDRADKAGDPVGKRLRIRDGARTYLVEPSEILAVAAAGNYVEYRLLDGRRPLTRARLADAEAELALLGFRRTHRSWLVNASHVREIRTLGSGDSELVVAGDLVVPVSRRYAPLLADLLPGAASRSPSS